jgi:hypothetical protein
MHVFHTDGVPPEKRQHHLREHRLNGEQQSSVHEQRHREQRDDGPERVRRRFTTG